MAPQQRSWTCGICAYQWVLEATGTASIDRVQAANIIGYPDCVNETYGLMNVQCLIDAFLEQGLVATQSWVTWAEAFSICDQHTGCINPVGMYHFMGIRGTTGNRLWVANSAPGYKGIWDTITRDQFYQLGPVQLIYL